MLLSELASRLSAELIGDGRPDISGVNTIQDAQAGQMCFVLSDKYVQALEQSRASAVLTQKTLKACPMAQLVVKDVQRGLITALGLFAPKVSPAGGIHPSAVVDPAAQVDPSACVGPGAVIVAGARIGASTVIGANCFIGQDTTIGQRCRLDANVAVYYQCRIGNDCIVQANSTIGSTGFGYYFINGRHELIPHNGGVILEDNVEIGANSCVDRAKFGNTLIGAGTKIDNQVQVAHNVQIGKHCLLAGQAALAGSVRLGNYVVLAGRTAIVDNRTIGDQVLLGACSLVIGDVESQQKMTGSPAQDLQREMRCRVIYQNLPDMAKELKQLRKKVESLDAAKDNQK